ncbi:MAG TPA: DUF5989 family protein [Verrucomicrobiae bacterium]|jgi:hypothetical protein|nr:DUF5989 family protein [Verrucomicrobiae bacterium]
MSFLSEIWAFLRHRKKFWLLPIVLVMLLFGGLVILSQISAVAPFIYTLF